MVFFISNRRFTRLLFFALFSLILSGCALQVERYYYGVKKGVSLEEYDLSYLLEDEVEDIVTQLALEKNRPPQDAGVDKETGQLVSSKPGQRVKISQTVYEAMHAAVNQKVYLSYEKITPTFDEKYFLSTRKLGQYVTWFYGKDGRYQNIKLALKFIDNTVIYPDEIFSFNRVVGPRTPKRGFMKAPSIGIAEDYGGGVCQVATTMYNAVQQAKLRVLERHEHSKPVRYVTVGKDATVNYGYLDFKFQNSLPYPIILKTSFKNYGVRVYIYGGVKNEGFIP